MVNERCLGKSFKNFNFDSILSNWQACMIGGFLKVRNHEQWSPPPVGTLKFNVDRAAKGKPGPIGIGGVLRNHDGLTLLSFSSYIAVIESNEAEILAIREAQRLYKVSFHHPLIVESDF